MIKIGRICGNKKRSGFTLIELIISLVILLIVITVSTNLLIFNQRVFKKSDSLSQVQFDVRMASDFLTSEMRNISSISVTDITLDKSIDIDFLESKYPLVHFVSFEIKSQSGRYLLAYVIEGEDSNSQHKYKLETEVLLNNVTNATIGSGGKIYYK